MSRAKRSIAKNRTLSLVNAAASRGPFATSRVCDSCYMAVYVGGYAAGCMAATDGLGLLA